MERSSRFRRCHSRGYRLTARRFVASKPPCVVFPNKIDLELDKLKGTNAFGTSSPFASTPTAAPAIPAELSGLFTRHQGTIKSHIPTKTALASADQDYAKLFDPANPTPPAPVYAARLNGLLKVLASAEGAVAESVKTREALIEELENLLKTSREALASDAAELKKLEDRKADIESKKQEVETSIMRGLSVPGDGHASPIGVGPSPHSPAEPDRPEMEALTPPSTSGEPELPEGTSTFSAPPSHQDSGFQHGTAPGIEMLSHLASQYQSLPLGANGSNKRRRLDDEAELSNLVGDEGIDPEVVELLKKDSGP